MSGWAEKAERAHRAGQHSYARVCEGRARAEWARKEAARKRTIAEQLDDAKDGEEFAGVLWKLFAAADAARTEEDEE